MINDYRIHYDEKCKNSVLIIRASMQFYDPKESFTQAGDLFGCIDGAEMKESVMQWFAPSTSAKHQAQCKSPSTSAKHQAQCKAQLEEKFSCTHLPQCVCVLQRMNSTPRSGLLAKMAVNFLSMSTHADLRVSNGETQN